MARHAGPLVVGLVAVINKGQRGRDVKGVDSESKGKGARAQKGKGKSEKGKRSLCFDGKGHIKSNCPQRATDEKQKTYSRSAPSRRTLWPFEEHLQTHESNSSEPQTAMELKKTAWEGGAAEADRSDTEADEGAAEKELASSEEGTHCGSARV